MKKVKNERFICVESSSLGFASHCTVLVDRKTGVNYLFATSGNAGGLTVLVDAQGNPVVTAVPREEN
jgi:hypothetical protein